MFAILFLIFVLFLIPALLLFLMTEEQRANYTFGAVAWAIGGLLLTCLVSYFTPFKVFNFEFPSFFETTESNVLAEKPVGRFDELPDLASLQTKMLKLETELYKINRIQEVQLIEGKVGNYYVIDLRKAKTKEIIYFQAGKYVIDHFDVNFRDAVNTFVQDILENQYIRNTNYELFILGSADIAGHDTFVAETDSRYLFPNGIKCLEIADSGNPYRYKDVKKNVGSQYTNVDLPNLRAEFVKLKIDELRLINKEITILSGSVTSVVNQLDRNAKLILYIPREVNN